MGIVRQSMICCKCKCNDCGHTFIGQIIWRVTWNDSMRHEIDFDGQSWSVNVFFMFSLDLSVFVFFVAFWDHPWRWFWRVKRVSEHVADNACGWTAAPAKHRTDTCSDDWLHIWTFKQAFAPLLKCSSKLPGNSTHAWYFVNSRLIFTRSLQNLRFRF